jgi:DNA-binding transcriptional MerR regulator
MDELLLIGDVAQACGVSVDTIRHYEAKEVIPPAMRGANGYRRYPRTVLERVQVVRRALAIGFTLDELARLFRRRAAGRPPCADVRAMAAEKLEALDVRIAEMIALRDDLAAIVADWERRLESSDGRPAHLLDTLGRALGERR